jgi:hypothetical protein
VLGVAWDEMKKKEPLGFFGRLAERSKKCSRLHYPDWLASLNSATPEACAPK